MHIEHKHFSSLESTNTWLKNHPEHFFTDKIFVVSSNEQTKGRGRYDRKWHSPPGLNLYTSFAFCLPNSEHHPGPLTQVLALSAIRFLRASGCKVQFKWPNDLVIQGKKIGGILCETLPLKDSVGMIMGIGLNINIQKKSLEHLDQAASSLAIESQKEWDLIHLRKTFINTFAADLKKYFALGFKPFHKSIHSFDSMKGETIRFYTGQHIWEGRYISHNSNGSMTMMTQEGKLKTFFSGDVFSEKQ